MQFSATLIFAVAQLSTLISGMAIASREPATAMPVRSLMEMDALSALSARDNHGLSVRGEDMSSFQKRTQTSGGCSVGAPYAGVAPTLYAVYNANRLHTTAAVSSTGASGVGLIACQGGAGVYLVNNQPQQVGGASVTIGAYALQLVISCTYWNGSGIAVTNGQICDSQGWCVIVSSC